MLKIKSKFTKRILAFVLSGAMIVSGFTTSGLTAYAEEDSRNTRGGYCEESSETDAEGENAQIEEAAEDEGNKDTDDNADFEKAAQDQTEPVKTEPTKMASDKEEPVTEDPTDTKDEEVTSTETLEDEKEQDENAEDLKAYTYAAPATSEKSKKWANYEVFRGSVFGYSSQDVTNTTYYDLKNDNGNMRISALEKASKISRTDDGRAMYFYQVPINSTFTLTAKATINEIGKGESSDSQVGFGLMARDDMLIDEKYDASTHNGIGSLTSYVAAGTLMGSTLNEAASTSINCFSRDNDLQKGVSLGENKIVAKGETYDLSLTFDGTEYTCQFGDYDPVKYTISLDTVDSAYQYIGMFASRHADITYSKIYLEVDGKRILDQVSTRYSVTVSKEGEGTVAADTTSVIKGDTVTLTAKAAKGYYLDDWQILSGTDLVTDFTIGNDNCFTMPEGNVSIKAIFKELPSEWDFSTDSTLAGKKIEQTTGKLKGLTIDATKGTFDSTDSTTTGWAQVSKGTTITVPLPGECTMTVVGKDTNYTVDETAAETAEDTFTCGGIFAKTAVITATEDTEIQRISVVASGEEVVLPETPRKIDVWDFGAKEQSGSDYVNHITVSDWTSFSKLANGRFTVDAGENPTQDATASFGDLTFCYHDRDILYSTTYTGGFNHQSGESMRAEATHEYGDYTAAGEWYCNGTGGSNRRCITINNVVAGDVIYAYLGVSNGIETKFYFEYLGTEEGKNQKDVGTVEKGSTNGVNKKFTFIAKYSGTYKIWADTAVPEGGTAAGKPFYNRIVRYPAVVVQGAIDWAGISRDDVSIQFVNDTTKEVIDAVFDRAGYAVILVPGYSYTIKLVGKDGYSFAEDCRKITVSNTDGINGRTHNLVVQDLESLPKQTVTGKFIGSGEVPLTGVNATKLVFKNIDDDYTYEAQIANDTYNVSLRKGTYLAEITADNYSTRTHVIVKDSAVTRDLFLASTDTSPLPLVKDLYVGYADKENNFATINAALKAAKRMNPQSEADRITVHIHPGTYREQVFVNANYITLINDTPSQDVLITWYYGIGYAYYSADDSGGKGTGYYNEESAYDKYEKHNAARWGCAVRVKATDFKAKNIIFENSFNRYITEEEIADGVVLSTEGAGTSISFKRTASVTPTQAASKDATERAAALALDTGSDRSEFYNCQFYSSQDTLYTGDGSSRAYYKNCLISGNTDYICGDGNQVFENCELQWQGYTSGANGGHITAAKDASTLGYLFYNCKITKNKTSGFTVPAGKGTLGRPWGEKARVTYVNTVQESENLIAESGWADWSSEKTAVKANYKEYNTTLPNGTAITLKSESAREKLYQKTNPIDTPEKLEAYFGADWKPTFYGSEEGGDNPESSSSGETGSAPESSGSSESGKTPESSETGSSSGESGETGESSSEPESDKTDESGSETDKGIHIKNLDPCYPSYPYTGAKIIPNIEVWDNNTLLVEGTDYTVKYSNNTEPTAKTGKPAEIIVTGKGNYVGKSEKKTFEIVEKDVPQNPINLKGAKITILGEPLQYEIDATTKKGKPQYPDFTLTRKVDNTPITETYTYNETKKGYELADDGPDKETPIAADVAVSNNVNKGTATILIRGEKVNGKVTSAKKTFKIAAVDMSKASSEDLKAEVIDKDKKVEYAVKGAAASVKVTYKGIVLKEGRDYTVKYAKNKKITPEATITVTGKGNFAKKYTGALTYEITPLDLSNVKVKAVTAYKDVKAGKVKATVVDKNGDALKPSQYALNIYRVGEGGALGTAYDKNDKIEESSIYVQAAAVEKDKNLTGETSLKAEDLKEAQFDVGLDISKAKVTGKDGKPVTRGYEGKPVILKKSELKVTLKVKGEPEPRVLEDTDYEIVTYANNINKGTATVVIKGIGAYSGTKTFKFKITQKKMELQGQ